MPFIHRLFSKSCPYEEISTTGSWFMGLLYLYIGYNAEQKTVQKRAGIQLSTGRKPQKTFRLLALSSNELDKQRSAQVRTALYFFSDFSLISTIFQKQRFQRQTQSHPTLQGHPTSRLLLKQGSHISEEDILRGHPDADYPLILSSLIFFFF